MNTVSVATVRGSTVPIHAYTLFMSMRVAAVWALVVTWVAVTASVLAADAEFEKKRAAEIGLEPGMMLDRTTAPRAVDLLPAEILTHYQKNEYRNEIVDWPLGRSSLGGDFEARTRWNSENLTAGGEGTIIEKASGQQPSFVYGTPFPKIDSSDPRAAVKILWNYFYTNSWWNGSTHTVVELLWLSPSGIDRKAGQDVLNKFYDGVPPDFRPRENSNNLLEQFIAMTTKPADLYGTAALSWRYRDSHKRDSVWAYVPALRRVRQVSPSNRSDGFLGSDLSQDDGGFFDGKPEDFTWKLVGEREMLVFVDPFRLTGEGEVMALPGGGWRGIWKDVPSFGFQDRSWTGVSWAPVAHKLARRKVWVIEGVPKDSYYLYGKIQLSVDQEDWHGVFNRKFSWKGELLSTLQIPGGPTTAMSDGVHFFSAAIGSGEFNQVAENIKMNRATGVTSDRSPGTPNDRSIPIDESFFDFQTLNRLGK